MLASPRGARLAAIGLVGLLSTTALAGCFGSVDPSYPYWILNDSDSPYTIEVREQLLETYVVPAHSYGPLFEAGSIDPGWSISFVDQQCTPLASFPVDAEHDLLYIDPTAKTELMRGLAWDVGLRTAKSLVFAAKDPPCANYVGSVVNDSDQPVVLDELGAVHQTWLVPAHARGPLSSFPSPPAPGWKLDLVDAACNILDSWPIESVHVLLHITTGGLVEFTADAPPQSGAGPSPSILVARQQACL